MNYRHAFHAGSFADVLKHAVLALVVEHLRQKPAPFRVVDTHAGAGLYDLDGDAASRTGEWRDGIGRLIGPGAAPLPAAAAAILAPYLDAVRAVNAPVALTCYPGSPVLVLHLLRPADRLVAVELHPQDRVRLQHSVGRDRRAKVLGIDGWHALKSLLPPRERRGAVLLDPPFEQEGELDRLVAGIESALARFAGGTYLIWHPIKDRAAVRAFRAHLAGLAGPGPDKLLAVELDVGKRAGLERLRATGLAIVNPPFRLEAQLGTLMPFLAERLAQGPGAGFAFSRPGTRG